MLSATRVAKAAAQSTAALAVNLLLLRKFGLSAEAVVWSNAAVVTSLLFLNLIVLVRETDSVGSERVWPTMGVLLVPIAFTGWSADSQILVSRPLLSATVAGSLALGLLLTLQASAKLNLDPPASEHPRPRREQARMLTYLVLSLVFIALLVSLGTAGIITRTSATHVGEPRAVVSLIALAYAFYGVHCAFVPSLRSSGRSGVTSMLGCCAIVVNLTLGLTLATTLGPIGAAAAAAATFLGLAATTWYSSHRAFPMTYELNRLAKIVASAVIVYAATLQWPINASRAWLLARLGMALVAFPIIISLSGFWKQQEHEAMRRWFRVVSSA